MKLFDLGGVEPELFQDFVVVLAEAGPAACRFLCDAVHLHGAADRKRQLASRAFERNDDVVARNCGSLTTSAGSRIAP